MNNALIKGFGITALAAAVAACGGSGSDDTATGTASFDVTDAPTMELAKVEITFTGLSVKPADGEAIEFTFDEAKTLDLLTLQGGDSAPLLEDQELPAGEYEWIRLTLDLDNSFVYETENPDAPLTLFVPSGAQTGLKLVSGFTIAQGGENNFTIDFDVRKSIVNPQGKGVADYFLKPALRLVDNLEVGSITGQVDYATINQARGSDDTEDALADCDYEGSVYVFEGADAELSDLNVNNEEGNPLMVVPVEPDSESGLYSYKAAFLTEGNYTVAYSCQLDDNEQDDTLEFDGKQTVAVEAGVETEAETIPLAQ
ncbi:DUF4382 domain-containing protein [Marinobacter sp. TBZ242]|uniref:DUF4382 domain-containing protein n=1 Tax=Marinobacter azerbaijanicus TaxID=3050455 RepID=A0ABT7IFF3_9GAMM|nr:DUF4382 domain-containing protein [Marinobacter sp. TBZ242]MDL0432477.1 DUF4382 domain-containing protein [Marinobacter sp. TBZ242]